jgi:hypothetical protein
VLLLGGSVLERKWGIIEPVLAAKLRAAVSEDFRIYNLARSAHTSRDSAIKYAHLAGNEFDLVIVYDGINDVRMNCCRREHFRGDYTHCSWYESLQKRMNAGRLDLPASAFVESLLTGASISLGGVDKALLSEGADIKTVGPLRQNLEGIVQAAAARGDAVVLMTYAYDIPADYTPERFANRTLAYGFRLDGCGAELWGRPADVAATLDAQNAAIRELASSHPEAPFCDQQQVLPVQTRLFVDPCHLSDEGCRQFVDNLWPAVEQQVAKWKGRAVVKGARSNY